MIYFYKNGKWTAIPTSSERYWELREFGNCKRVSISLPSMPSFGWEMTPDRAHKTKTFTNKQFKEYLQEQRKIYKLMLDKIDDVFKEVENDL